MNWESARTKVLRITDLIVRTNNLDLDLDLDLDLVLDIDVAETNSSHGYRTVSHATGAS